MDANRLTAWLSADFWIAAGVPARVAGIVLLAIVTRFLIHRLINRAVRRAESGVLSTRLGRVTVSRAPMLEHLVEDRDGRRAQRAAAIGSLLKSIASGVVWTIAVTMILSQLGLDIAPLLASAGILGVALGFGAQQIVRDFLAGVSMIFEDQFGVGDVIDVGHASGTVEAISLRVTRLRDDSGTVWFVRNGEVVKLGNRSQNWARLAVDVVVDPSAELSQVRTTLGEVIESFWTDDEFARVLVERPELLGVHDADGHAVIFRVEVKTPPLEQHAVARELRERIVRRFALDGIPLGTRGTP